MEQTVQDVGEPMSQMYLKQRRGEHDSEGGHQLVLTLLQNLKAVGGR